MTKRVNTADISAIEKDMCAECRYARENDACTQKLCDGLSHYAPKRESKKMTKRICIWCQREGWWPGGEVCTWCLHYVGKR